MSQVMRFNIVRHEDYAALEQKCEGPRAQHARDSAELRDLCRARDDARRERDAALQQVEALRELLAKLRQMVCATPENDLDQSGAWISTKHPVIKRIDAALQADPCQQKGDIS